MPYNIMQCIAPPPPPPPPLTCHGEEDPDPRRPRLVHRKASREGHEHRVDHDGHEDHHLEDHVPRADVLGCARLGAARDLTELPGVHSDLCEAADQRRAEQIRA
jgi:hypothetical protein